MAEKAELAVQPIQNILVYLPKGPGETAVLERAARLAAESGANVEIVDAVADLPLILRTPTFGYPALSETLEAEMCVRLEKAAKKIRSGTVAVSVKALYGKAFVEVTREAMRGGHNLVAVHADREGGRHLAGTTAMRLLRNCPAPVWAIHGESPAPYKKVLAAVDPLSGYDHENALNRRILETARTFAALEGAELHVVHAWGREDPPELLQPYAEEVKEAAGAALEELIKPYQSALASHGVHLVSGRPAEAIRRLVAREKIDLLVMGTLVRTGLEGLLIGNTAEKLLGDVECSVLALKPEGFRTPVQLD